MSARLARLVLSLRIVAVAVFVPVLMRLDLRLVGRVLEPRRTPSAAAPGVADALAAHVESVLRAARPLVRPGCLTRGVTLYWFLRRAGVDVSLAFGVGVPAASYEGHCWLVRDGVPYREAVDPRDAFTEVFAIRPRRGLAAA